jgi:glycosyltransferase involved in cell wall biosynthesis
MTGLTVAVTIITRNRLESLRYCLACVAQQTHLPNEIIVVDSSTDSATGDFVKEHYPGACYVHMTAPLGSQPRLRNQALECAKSDIIAATDDDGYPQPGWLEAILKSYGPGVGAVGGRILQGDADAGKAGRRPNAGTITVVGGARADFNAVWSEPFEVDHLQGTNMSFRRDLLNQAGGWDLTLESGYAAYEDTETCLRIKRLGYKVIYTPHAIVQHGLEARQGGFTRDFGASVPLAYSVSRNAVYTMLRSYRLVPGVIVGGAILAPIANAARILLPIKGGGSGRSLAISPTRLRAVAAIITGHLAGLAWVMRRRKENPWPRLNSDDRIKV